MLVYQRVIDDNSALGNLIVIDLGNRLHGAPVRARVQFPNIQVV